MTAYKYSQSYLDGLASKYDKILKWNRWNFRIILVLLLVLIIGNVYSLFLESTEGLSLLFSWLLCLPSLALALFAGVSLGNIAAKQYARLLRRRLEWISSIEFLVQDNSVHIRAPEFEKSVSHDQIAKIRRAPGGLYVYLKRRFDSFVVPRHIEGFENLADEIGAWFDIQPGARFEFFRFYGRALLIGLPIVVVGWTGLYLFFFHESNAGIVIGWSMTLISLMGILLATEIGVRPSFERRFLSWVLIGSLVFFSVLRIFVLPMGMPTIDN